MSLLICSIYGFYPNYHGDDPRALSSYLTDLVNTKDTTFVSKQLTSLFPAKSYSMEVVVEVADASDTVLSNLKAIIEKFENVNVCCRKAMNLEEQEKIDAFLKGLDFMEGQPEAM